VATGQSGRVRVGVCASVCVRESAVRPAEFCITPAAHRTGASSHARREERGGGVYVVCEWTRGGCGIIPGLDEILRLLMLEHVLTVLPHSSSVVSRR
jgi:hypothetical protein